VDATTVQADVIGEGGNLGITQRGRVELARQGTRLNTDFIDNSGGVDLSDREVNLKILLRKSIELEEIEAANRENHLDAFQDHAIQGVLQDSYRQSGTISLEVRNSDQHLEDVRSLLNTLEENGHFQRGREHFPDDKELDERQRAGEGLTRPEAAVLLSAVKQDLYRKSLEDSWPEETILDPFLEQYLPDKAPSELARGVENHPLKKNIALTELVNYAVDSVGYSFFHQLRDQLGTDLMTVLKAFRTADYFSRGESIRDLLFEQDGVLDPDVQYEAWTTFVDRIGHVVSWLVDTINESLVYHGFQNRMSDGLQDRFETVRETLREPQAEYYRQNIQQWKEKGFPTEFAEKIAQLSYLVPALEVILVHRNHEDRDFRELSETYFELGQILNVDWIIRQVYEREPQSRWDELAFRSLGVEAHNIQRDVLNRIIQDQHRLDEFIDQNETTISRLNELQQKLAQEDTQKFSAYQYMLQRIRSLL
jgi:glutamate dehydrogenase